MLQKCYYRKTITRSQTLQPRKKKTQNTWIPHFISSDVDVLLPERVSADSPIMDGTWANATASVRVLSRRLILSFDLHNTLWLSAHFASRQARPRGQLVEPLVFSWLLQQSSFRPPVHRSSGLREFWPTLWFVDGLGTQIIFDARRVLQTRHVRDLFKNPRLLTHGTMQSHSREAPQRKSFPCLCNKCHQCTSGACFTHSSSKMFVKTILCFLKRFKREEKSVRQSKKHFTRSSRPPRWQHHRFHRVKKRGRDMARTVRVSFAIGCADIAHHSVKKWKSARARHQSFSRPHRADRSCPRRAPTYRTRKPISSA